LLLSAYQLLFPSSRFAPRFLLFVVRLLLLFVVCGVVVLPIFHKWMNDSDEEDKGNELSFQPIPK